MIVVPVFMTSCQVSEKPNKGPVIPQTTIIANAIIKADGLPVARVTFVENASNTFPIPFL